MRNFKYLLVLLLFPSLGFAQKEARLLRFPSTNDQQIAFTYAGDLYSVDINGGLARKLTSDVGFEMFSHFSPDGKTLAFTAQYDGNTEVYTMPSEGGIPKRITYTATIERDDVSDRMGPNNIVMAWTPDGKEIIYRSKKQSFGFPALLFKVPATGGLSEQLPLPDGGFCSFSENGQQLAYNKVFREFRTWKYYQGGMADDIWIHDFKTKQTINVTNNKAQDIIPMWIGEEVFFISDRDRTMNLFVYNMKTKQTEKLTDFKDFDIKFPSHFKNYIVFENGGYIYKFDVKQRKAVKIEIKLADDLLFGRDKQLDVSDKITNLSLSPSGERVLVSARGEVFDIPVKKGATYNLTLTPGAHERGGSYSPVADKVAFISDKTGETELYIKEKDGKETQLTKNNTTYILDFFWSPDGKKIAYTDRQNRLQIVDVESKQVRLVARDPRGIIYSFSWSPDNKWLSYSLRESNEMRVVYLYNLESNRQYAVTDRQYDAGNSTFSSNGKYLYFVSPRNFNPTYGNTEWNHVYTNMYGIYFVTLSKDTPSPFEITNDKAVETKEEKKEEKKDTKPETKDNSIKIDTDGIINRILSLPLAGSYYGGLNGVGDKLYYFNNGRIKMFDLTTSKETDIAEANNYDITADGKKMLIQRGKSISVVALPTSSVNPSEFVDLSGMKVNTNYKEEWAQIFDESYRHMRDGFYVKNMHGVDWPAMKKKYAVLLPYVNHRADLTYIIGEMIGELNVGHAYVNSGDMPRPDRIKMGLLGAQLSKKSGYYRIDKILEGANWSSSLRSPLTELGINAKEGEYITAVNSISVTSVNDIYELLQGKAGIKTELSINTKPEDGGRKVIIEPLATENQLYYYNWVQENIRKVDKATGGRVGYIHIPDMGVPGLNEFSRYFYSQLDKEALIIDDRGNGGGNVSPMILERLARIPYRATAWRHSEYPGVIPNKTLVGPKVALVDKYSMSDGDLFAYGFKELKLGKLIGRRTWGGVVGISGSLPFIDGADLRVPMFTSYSMETGKWVIEGYGVDPDIDIDNDPYKEYMGEDEQLNKAIEEILKDLKNRKPIPPIPADPIR